MTEFAPESDEPGSTSPAPASSNRGASDASDGWRTRLQLLSRYLVGYPRFGTLPCDLREFGGPAAGVTSADADAADAAAATNGGGSSQRGGLKRFASERDSIAAPLALQGKPVLYVLAVPGCRFCDYMRMVMERAARAPVAPGVVSERELVLGDAIEFVWVDCGASAAAESFCRARHPRRLPHAELVQPVPPEGAEGAAAGDDGDDNNNGASSGSEGTARITPFRNDCGVGTVGAGNERRYDASVYGVRTFLRHCGALPPAGLPRAFYEQFFFFTPQRR